MSRVLALSVLLLTSCSVDDRTLLGVASGGDGSYGGSFGAAGNAGDAGESGSGGSGGSLAGSAGSAGQDAGTSGADGGGSSGAGGGSAGSGDAGNGGAATVCPDLDGNSVPDCMESLVKNPSFDAPSSDSDWVVDLNATQSWAAQDAEQRAQSGSLGVQNATTATVTGLTMSGSRQCVAASAGASYSFYVNVFVAGDQGSAGAGGVNMSFFASSDCSGDALYGKTSNLPENPDIWSLAKMTSVAPSYTKSMSIRLVSVKTFEAQPLTVLFDDVLVKQDLSQPSGP